MPTDLAESSASSIDPFSSWESTSISEYSHSEDKNEPFIAQPSNSRPTTLNTTGTGNQRESKEDASPLSHKDREERMRQFKERLEEDRSRRLQELEQASAHAQRIRELQEEDRKRKIEELRYKDLERRHAVEERKRQIWEAEQERKSAILRRNLDREAKIEARRNAQRNSMSFAFGSSTPRTLDLDPGFVTYYRTAGNVMVVNGRNPDEKDMEYYKRRPPSADILDARQELSPSPREFDQHIVETNSLNLEPPKGNVKQPYRRSFAGMSSDETKACLTMTESSLESPLCFVRQMPFFYHAELTVGEDLMTRSMVSLSSSVARGRRRTDLTPTIPSYRDLSLRSSSPANQTKRAVSMSRLDLLSQPRRRTIDSSSAAAPSGNTRTSKEISQSPSRPRSSMSIASEKSATSSHQSTVSMRVRSAPRRPRPVSIAGTIPDTPPPPQPPPRQSRTAERKVPVNTTPPTRPSRAKSAGPVNEAEAKTQSKPPPVPKPVAVAKPLLPADDQTEVKIVDTSSLDAVAQQPQQAEEVVGEEQQNGSPTNKPRITSEEAAKAALAEKRRLAREQAEREAELERQRQEQLRREEEEQKMREEEEQRKMEEEAARLVEALRQQEEEKLRKAIEEQEKLEEELKLQREEEAKQKAEREELEKKAKEEAEKQRKELEEKLVKEEAERAERKKRVEQIMKRTRGKGAPNSSSSQENSVKDEAGESANSDGEKEMEVSAMQAVENNGHQLNGQSEKTESDGQSSSALDEEQHYSNASAADHAATVNTKNDHNIMLDSAPIALSEKLGNMIVESVSIQELSSESFGNVAQTNGYKSDETHFKQHITPDEKINPLVENLLDFDPLSSNSIEKMNTSPSPDFNGLIDFSSAANTATNQNEIFLNNTDDINSNRMTANPFISFEENANMKQESTVTDLLS